MIPFKFVITDTHVCVKLGRLVVRKIALSDIESVEQRYAAWNEHWDNLWPLKFLTIRRKTGLFKNFVINPPNIEAFIKELNKKLGK